MADTAVAAINEIIEDGGGTADAKTIVEAIGDLAEAIGGGGGGGVEDGSITTDKLADGAVTADKIASGVIGSVNPQYGTSSTAAATAAKEATCTGFELEDGARIAVKFTNGNSSDAPTLNVNDTGAKAVYNDGAAVSAYNPVKWCANALLTFVYDGTNWNLEDKATSLVCTSNTTASADVKVLNVQGGRLIVNGTVLTLLAANANTHTSSSVKLTVGDADTASVARKYNLTSPSNTLTWGADSVLMFVRLGEYWYYTAGELNS